MGKIRKGNYIFLSWVGDHGYHVHVYKNGRQVLKWDLLEQKSISGRPKRKIIRMLIDLKKKGLL